MNESIILGKITQSQAKILKDKGEEVCYKKYARRGSKDYETICARITGTRGKIRASLDNGYGVPYDWLVPRKDWTDKPPKNPNKIVMTPDDVRKIKARGEKLCFTTRMGESICEKIVRVNPQTVTFQRGNIKYRIPYINLVLENDFKVPKTTVPTPRTKNPKKPFVPTGDTNYDRSNMLTIRSVPKAKLGPMQTRVKKMGACLDSMRETRKACSTLESAKCQASFDDDRKCVEKNAQGLIDRLNDHYKISKNKILVDGTRKNYRSGGDLYGYYRTGTGMTRVFPYTKKKQEVVANKTFLKTTVHEWNHHYDHKALDLNSIHTAGFYTRVGTIYNQLKTVFD